MKHGSELKARSEATAAEMVRIMNQRLYGDPDPLPPRTIRTAWTDLAWRIQCAWLVLRGKADIGS